MNTLINRLQATTGRFSTAVAVASFVIAVVAWLQVYAQGGYSLTSAVPSIEPRMTWRTTRRFGSPGGKPRENARVKFDLEADLSPLFNWNTKQVFAYLALEYGGPRGRENDIDNSVVVWDKILTSPDQAKLKLRNERGKYSVWDVTDSFDGREANVTLRWNVQPWVGFLLHGSAQVTDGSSTVRFPFTAAEAKSH